MKQLHCVTYGVGRRCGDVGRRCGNRVGSCVGLQCSVKMEVPIHMY